MATSKLDIYYWLQGICILDYNKLLELEWKISNLFLVSQTHRQDSSIVPWQDNGNE